jgi:hypothetical protein
MLEVAAANLADTIGQALIPEIITDDPVIAISHRHTDHYGYVTKWAREGTAMRNGKPGLEQWQIWTDLA